MYIAGCALSGPCGRDSRFAGRSSVHQAGAWATTRRSPYAPVGLPGYDLRHRWHRRTGDATPKPDRWAVAQRNVNTVGT